MTNSMVEEAPGMSGPRDEAERRGLGRPAAITPPKGTLGVLTAGMGAVSTTFMAGVELVRKGVALPIGSGTQLGTVRLGERTEGRPPLIRTVLPLDTVGSLGFGGRGIFPRPAVEGG